MAALTDIIERLEKATGPDRELDAAVWASICKAADFTDFRVAAECSAEFEPAEDGSVRMYIYGPREEGPNYVGRRPAPHYSSSVDAALTLKPDGWEFVFWTENGLVEAYPTKGVKRPVGIKFRVQGHDLALAICIAVFKIAALEARTA